MSNIKLITQSKEITDSVFSSATEENGEYIGQPVHGSSNSGYFSPITQGNIVDFSYDGVCTVDGAPGGTTLGDKALAVFGNDYFISGGVTVTDLSEHQTITDFAVDTVGGVSIGIVTFGAFSTRVSDTSAYTLTLPFRSRSFLIELITDTCDDMHDATFKWSHNGGTTYLGRDDPATATWKGPVTIVDSNVKDSSRVPMAEASNGNMVMLYQDDNDSDKCKCKISSDGHGLSWGTASDVTSSAAVPYDLIKQASGRLLAIIGSSIYYSDNNGVAWCRMGAVPATGTYSLCEVSREYIVAVRAATDTSNAYVYAYQSSNGGKTWGDAVTIDNYQNAEADETTKHAFVRAKNDGTIYCVYLSDEDHVDEFDVCYGYSTDDGDTWSVVRYTSEDANYAWPGVFIDIDDGANFYYSKTDTDTIYFNTNKLLIDTDNDPRMPFICLVHGHYAFCSMQGSQTDIAYFVRRGCWETYSSNACPCADALLPQRLSNKVETIWHGHTAVSGDTYAFSPDYYYSAKNILSNEPGKEWRSENDNVVCKIVFDMGARQKAYVTGVGIFNTNLRSFDFEMDEDSAFGSPEVNETVTTDLVHGAVDDATSAVSGNWIQDASLFNSTYKDHCLAGSDEKHYLRMTSGASSGYTWEVKDNYTGGFIQVDEDANLGGGVTKTNTFAIYKDHGCKTFTGNACRYFQLNIPAQRTPEGYYKIGSLVVGIATDLDRGRPSGYSHDYCYNIEMVMTPSGGMFPIKHGPRRRKFGITWDTSDDARRELIAVADYAEGGNVCVLPGGVTTECYLMKLVGDITTTNDYGERYDTTFVLEENK